MGTTRCANDETVRPWHIDYDFRFQLYRKHYKRQILLFIYINTRNKQCLMVDDHYILKLFTYFSAWHRKLTASQTISNIRREFFVQVARFLVLHTLISSQFCYSVHLRSFFFLKIDEPIALSMLTYTNYQCLVCDMTLLSMLIFNDVMHLTHALFIRRLYKTKLKFYHH